MLNPISILTMTVALSLSACQDVEKDNAQTDDISERLDGDGERPEGEWGEEERDEDEWNEEDWDQDGEGLSNGECEEIESHAERLAEACNDGNDDACEEK